MSSATLAIRVVTDAVKAARDVDQLGDSSSRLARAHSRAAAASKGIVGGIGAIAVVAGKAASAQQQAFGAVDSVFGKSSKQVKKLAADAAGSVGLAKSQYADLAAVLGSQLRNMGVSSDQLVGKTDGLVKLGGDLAATFGGTTADAVESLSALLRGETDPIEKYGVSIKQADIQAQLAAKGQDKLKGAAAKTAKTQAILELLNKQTAKAQGQRAREANSAQSRQEVATAKLKNASAALGAVLLPIMAAVSSALAKAAGFVEKNRAAFTVLIAVVGALAVATLATNGAIAAYTAVTKIARAGVIVFRNAQLALNLAMRANPIGLIITAIILLIGFMVLAYKKNERFRAIVNAVGRAGKAAIGWVVDKVRELIRWIGTNAPAAFNAAKRIAVAAFLAYTFPIRTVISFVQSLIRWVRDNVPNAARRARDVAVGAFNTMTRPIERIIALVRDLIDKLRSIKPPSLGRIGSAIGGVFSFAGRGPSGGGTPAGFAATSSSTPTAARSLVGGARSLVGSGSSSRSSSSSTGGVTIIVQGALDPDAVAKQIEKLLGRRRVRLGSVSGG